MQLNNLQPSNTGKNVKRVGRGGKRGTYSGKGMKGQKSRAGRRFKPVIRELIKRYPKLRGHRQNTVSLKPAIVNLNIVEKQFEEGAIVSVASLLDKKIISKLSGKAPIVKILGNGRLTKKMTFDGLELSKSAKEKIEKAKGIIK